MFLPSVQCDDDDNNNVCTVYRCTSMCNPDVLKDELWDGSSWFPSHENIHITTVSERPPSQELASGQFEPHFELDQEIGATCKTGRENLKNAKSQETGGFL